MTLGNWLSASEGVWKANSGFAVAVGIVALTLLVLVFAEDTSNVLLQAALGCALSAWVSTLVFPPLAAWATGRGGTVVWLVLLTMITVGLFVAAGALVLTAYGALVGPARTYALVSGLFYLLTALYALPGFLGASSSWMGAFLTGGTSPSS